MENPSHSQTNWQERFNFRDQANRALKNRAQQVFNPLTPKFKKYILPTFLKRDV